MMLRKFPAASVLSCLDTVLLQLQPIVINPQVINVELHAGHASILSLAAPLTHSAISRDIHKNETTRADLAREQLAAADVHKAQMRELGW